METRTVRENYKREILYVLFSHIRLIVGTTIFFFIVGLLVAFLWPPTYTATAKIMIQGKGVEQNLGALEAVRQKVRVFKVSKEDLASEKQLVTSYNVICRTIEALKKKNLYRKSPEQKGLLHKITGFFTSNKNKNGSIIVEKRYLSIVNEAYKIKKKLKSKIVTGSNVVEVVFYDRDPKYAVTFLKELVNQYKNYRTMVFNPSRKIDFFKEQAERFNRELKQRDEEFLRIAEKTNVTDPENEIKKNIALQKALELTLIDLRKKYLEKKFYIEEINKALKKKKEQQSFSFINNKIINDLETELTKRRLHRIILLKIYVPTAKKILLEDDEIRHIYALLKRKVRAFRDGLLNELKIFDGQIKETENRINLLKKRNVLLQKQALMLQRVKREQDLLKYSLETFLKRSEEAKINNIAARANFSTYIKILAEAIPSDAPVFPRKAQVIPISLLIGLILGLTLAFLTEYFDHTFKKPEDVESILGLPVLFSIPDAGLFTKKPTRRHGKFETSMVSSTHSNRMAPASSHGLFTYLVIVLIVLNSIILFFFAISYLTTQKTMLHFMKSQMAPKQNQIGSYDQGKSRSKKIKINSSALQLDEDKPINKVREEETAPFKLVGEENLDLARCDFDKSVFAEPEQKDSHSVVRSNKISETKSGNRIGPPNVKTKMTDKNIPGEKEENFSAESISNSVKGKITLRQKRTLISIAKLVQRSLVLQQGNSYYLQVYSLKSKEKAREEANKLKKLGFKNVIIQEKTIDGYGTTHRIFLGKFSLKKAAVRYKENWRLHVARNLLVVR